MFAGSTAHTLCGAYNLSKAHHLKYKDNNKVEKTAR